MNQNELIEQINSLKDQLKTTFDLEKEKKNFTAYIRFQK